MARKPPAGPPGPGGSKSPLAWIKANKGTAAAGGAVLAGGLYIAAKHSSSAGSAGSATGAGTSTVAGSGTVGYGDSSGDYNSLESQLANLQSQVSASSATPGPAGPAGPAGARGPAGKAPAKPKPRKPPKKPVKKPKRAVPRATGTKRVANSHLPISGGSGSVSIAQRAAPPVKPKPAVKARTSGAAAISKARSRIGLRAG